MQRLYSIDLNGIFFEWLVPLIDGCDCVDPFESITPDANSGSPSLAVPKMVFTDDLLPALASVILLLNFFR